MAGMDSVRRLAAGGVLLARERLELAALDVEDELLRAGAALATMLFIAVLAGLCLAALGALVVVLFWDAARTAALLGVALVFGAAAGWAAWRLKHMLARKPPFLGATLDELARDGLHIARSSR